MLVKLIIVAFTICQFISCSKKSVQPEALENGMTQTEQAEVAHFFEEFCKLGENYDPSYVDYYSDKALIKTNRIYPNGKTKEIVIPAVKYKKLIRNLMPLAKKKGDKSTFKVISYGKKENRYTIIAVRHSVLKNYDGSYIMRLERLENGEFTIVEEILETRPF